MPIQAQRVREGQGAGSRRGEVAQNAGHGKVGSCAAPGMRGSAGGSAEKVQAGSPPCSAPQQGQAKRRKHELMGAGALLSIAGSRKGGSAAAPCMRNSAGGSAGGVAAVAAVRPSAQHQARDREHVEQAEDALGHHCQDAYVLVESDIFA